jgi:hypothetical protein
MDIRSCVRAVEERGGSEGNGAHHDANGPPVLRQSGGVEKAVEGAHDDANGPPVLRQGGGVEKAVRFGEEDPDEEDEDVGGASGASRSIPHEHTCDWCAFTSPLASYFCYVDANGDVAPSA